MKALAAERAEVVQEGCKPEFGVAQREMEMIFQGKAEAKHGLCRSGLSEQAYDGFEPEECNTRKGGEWRKLKAEVTGKWWLVDL